MRFRTYLLYYYDESNNLLHIFILKYEKEELQFLISYKIERISANNVIMNLL